MAVVGRIRDIGSADRVIDSGSFSTRPTLLWLVVLACLVNEPTWEALEVQGRTSFHDTRAS